MIKKLIVPFLLFLVTAASAQRGIEIAIMRTQILALEQYLVDGEFHAPANEGDRFMEMQVQIRNSSSYLVQLDLRSWQIDLLGEKRNPAFVLSNAFERAPEASVPSLEASVRKLVYSVPASANTEDVKLCTKYTTVEYDPFTAAHVYFNDKWEQLSTAEGATYYRRSAGVGQDWIVRNYFAANGQIQMESEANQVFPLTKHGLTTWYQTKTARCRSRYSSTTIKGLVRLQSFTPMVSGRAK